MTYEFAAKIWRIKQFIGRSDSALRRFCMRVSIGLPDKAQILDVGCGTGTMGLAFLEKFPHAHLVATDVNGDMLLHTWRRARRFDPTLSRVTIGKSDIKSAHKVLLLQANQWITLKPGSFDLAIAGAVLEHVEVDNALAELRELLKPNGYLLLNIMKKTSLSYLSSQLYRFNFLSVEDLIARLDFLKFSRTRVVPFIPREFPSNFYRIGIIAQKGDTQ
jgi:ubiquinone/menaquinone biosynthesis C-methylase UbiE